MAKANLKDIVSKVINLDESEFKEVVLEISKEKEGEYQEDIGASVSKLIKTLKDFSSIYSKLEKDLGDLTNKLDKNIVNLKFP
jgi:hypothetical protein